MRQGLRFTDMHRAELALAREAAEEEEAKALLASWRELAVPRTDVDIAYAVHAERSLHC